MSDPTPARIVELASERYDPAAFAARLDLADAGAVATFTGYCRSEDGRLKALELEHYPGMALRMLGRIAADASRRHALTAIGVVHRHGVVPVGEPIVTVIAAARHRREAFAAAQQVMDYLKTDAPFWKKEHPVDGRKGEWVAAAQADDKARARWEI